MSSKALIKKAEEHRDAFDSLRDRILAATDDRDIISITDKVEVLLEELVDALVEDEDGQADEAPDDEDEEE